MSGDKVCETIDEHRRCDMKFRIAMWAAAGFLVAGCWALYFLLGNRDYSVAPAVSTLVRLSCPVAVLHYPVSVYLSFFANTATYALVGLVVETVRRQLNHSH